MGDGDVRVDLGRLAAGVAEEFLDVPEVGASFQNVCREGVAEGMRCHRFLDAGGLWERNMSFEQICR